MAFADKKFFIDNYAKIETILKEHGVIKAYIRFDQITHTAKAIYVDNDKKFNPGLLIVNLKNFFVSKGTSYNTLSICALNLFDQKMIPQEGSVLFSTLKTKELKEEPAADNSESKSNTNILKL